MAELIGFQGVRYDTARLGVPLANLVAPPYDVISPAEQDALLAKDPHNVVHLTLGRGEDKYQDAARLFRQWLADGVLVKDDAEAVYVYRQQFQDPATGAPCPERVGLVCLLKLEEYETGGVLPHEDTLPRAKADRLALMQATDAQFEPIFGLYSDPDRAVQSFLGEYADREPAMETVSAAIGSGHLVERLTDENALATLQALMQDKQIFIADGHHRYETALQHRRTTREAQNTPPDTPIPEDYILISLTAFEDEGLLVLPTHRMIAGIAPERIAALPGAIADEFTVEARDADALDDAVAAQAAAGKTAFGMLLPDGKSVLATWNGQAGDGAEQLPVSLLHSRILENALGIGPEELKAGGFVTYTCDSKEAQAAVQTGKAQAAFLLPRPTVEMVRAVSLAGAKMAQKSTFFFPKLLSGLLMRDLR